MLVAGKKQSRQAWSRLGSPDCVVSLRVSPFALLASLLCFVPATSTCFQCVFLYQSLTVLTRQTRQAVCAIKQSFL